MPTLDESYQDVLDQIADWDALHRSVVATYKAASAAYFQGDARRREVRQPYEAATRDYGPYAARREELVNEARRLQGLLQANGRNRAIPSPPVDLLAASSPAADLPTATKTIRQDDYITTEAAARQLGISVRRVQVLIAAGRLPALKLGRDYLIAPADLRLVAQRRPGRPRKGAAPDVHLAQPAASAPATKTIRQREQKVLSSTPEPAPARQADGVRFKRGRSHYLGDSGKTLCGQWLPMHREDYDYTYGEPPTCRRCRERGERFSL